MDLDLRRTAVYAGRIRVGLGLTLLLAPRFAAALWTGRGTGRAASARVMMRAVGARDAVIGAGTAIAAAEREGGAGWLSMAALADAADAVVSLATPGMPRRTRLVGLFAVAGAVGHLVLARQLAEEERPPAA